MFPLPKFLQISRLSFYLPASLTPFLSQMYIVNYFEAIVVDHADGMTVTVSLTGRRSVECED